MEHEPLHLHVVAGVAPVAQGVEVAHEQALLQPSIDARQAAGDLAGHERLTAAWALVVKQDAVAGIHSISLAVVHRDPIGVELGHAVGTARIKGCGLLLGHLLHQAVELARAGLINAGFGCEAQHPHRFENAQGAKSVGIGGVFRRLKTYCHMALSAEVVNLIRLHLLNDPDQVGAVGEVAVVED